jgi:hypothetical protein
LTVLATDALARDRMATDWVDWARTQPDELLGEGVMLAARRVDVDALNRTARTLLRAAGRLGPDTLLANGRAYAVGERVVCLRNNRALSITNGTRGAITCPRAVQRRRNGPRGWQCRRDACSARRYSEVTRGPSGVSSTVNPRDCSLSRIASARA